MLWLIIKVLFFIFIVLPIIFYVLSCIFEGIGDIFKAIISFPDKVIKTYRENKIKGLVGLFIIPLAILDWCLFSFGLMSILASLAILIDTGLPIYFGLIAGVGGCLLMVLSMLLYVKYLYPEFKK